MSWKLEQDGFIKTWAQDVRNSYMIRLKYVVVPKGVKTNVRYIDTPYRFQSYQEAREYAKELFPCYGYSVQGSADRPNFNETQFVQRISKDDMNKIKYYDLYGVKPGYIKTSNPGVNSLRNYNSVANTKSMNNVKKLNSTEMKKLNDIQVLKQKLAEKEAEILSLKRK
jgi:hypothetical protein